MAAKNEKDRSRAWQPATRLVHEGTLRSQFGETSEAIFLNSGYVYESAEQAEARFKGDEDGYVYSRYANPTVSMFETRMCALEGAEAARGTASGMAAVAASLLCHLKAGDHVVSGRPRGKRRSSPTPAPSSSSRRPIRCWSSWTSRA
jgi:O-succinylhomoserine sulfhydrylase